MPEKPGDNPEQAAWPELVTHDGLFSVDSRQCIMYWSDSAQRILGFRPEEVAGQRCYEVIGGRDSRNYRFCRRNCPVMMNARRGRPTPDYDLVCILPSGEEKWLNVSVAVPKEKRGDFQVLHLFRDVTHRRSIEQFARKATVALHALLGEGRDTFPEDSDPSPTPLPKLSPREMQILRLLASGMTTAQIAEALQIRPITARNHASRLLTKLGVGNRLQAVVYASQHGLL